MIPGIDNPPAPMPPSELEQTVQRLRNGDGTAASPIILGHMRLALHLASAFARGMGYHRRDLVGVAYLALVEAVQDATIKLHDNCITPYLSAKIRGALQNAKAEMDLIRVPHDSQYKLDVRPPVRQYGTSHEAESRLRPEQELEADEIIDAVCDSSRDRRVVEHLIAGFTIPQIADRLNVSTRTIESTKAQLKVNLKGFYDAM